MPAQSVMQKTKVTAAIVTYGGYQEASAAARSILQQTTGVDLTLYLIDNNSPDDTGEKIEREFAGSGYGDFKLAVGETVADKLAPVQSEQARLLADKQYLESVLRAGAERAGGIAASTLSKVYRKIGFYQL